MPITITGAQAPDDATHWDPIAYEHATRRVLTVVQASRVGSTLLSYLWKHLEIHPARSVVHRRSSSAPTDPPASRPEGEPHRRHADERGPGNTTGEPVPGSAPGTGRGSDVEIRFSPAHYLPPDAPIPAGSEAPAYADVVLLHELVHAVRCMWGVHDFRRFDPDPAVGWGFLNSEEFCTLLVENMYRAERHIPLRGSYLGTHRMTWRPNPRRLADPYTRLQHAWVRRWVREMPRLVHALERIPRVVAHYNPFADARYGRYGRVPAVSRGSYRVGELVDLGPLVFPGGQ